MNNLSYQNFSNVNLKDPFFDSLRNSYPGFEQWFIKKSNQNENAYVLHSSNNCVEGFLYLKHEIINNDSGVTPPLPNGDYLKIGTFKVKAIGTNRGQRFIKKIFDMAIHQNINQIYVTIFPEHEALINLFYRYGFTKHGEKLSANGKFELVLIKKIRNLASFTNNVYFDYPTIFANNQKHYSLSIYPGFHARLFPDSILRTESPDILQDCSETNSIEKVYICAMDGTLKMKHGDNLIIYRIGESKPKHYSSVITSLCVVDDVINIEKFSTFNEFYDFVNKYSVFSKSELESFYKEKRYPYIIKFTYNYAFKKRLNKAKLMEIGINPSYWGFFEINQAQFDTILRLSF